MTSSLIAGLTAVVGPENVLHRRDEMLVYECDGYMVEKRVPDVVVFPTSTEHVVEIVKLCNRHEVPFVPRGAGTSLAGGTLTIGGGVMICLTRMKRILEVSIRDRYAIVESGVVNVWLTRSLAGTGFHYAPDPSSQGACTIGGNVATNSGGPHTLKYGVTVNHIKGATLVMPDGTLVETGGVTEDNPGYDLTGLIVGNEGTFGIVTKVVVNLTRDPEAGRTLLAVFDTVDQATETVSGIIAAGIVPAALEMLDNLMIRAVEQAFGFGFPVEAGAVLIIEVDGLDAGLDREAQAITQIVHGHGGSVGRSITWRTRKEPEYVAIWKSRKSAFGAIGRLSPTYCTQDGVVPRTKLPEILRYHRRGRQAPRSSHRQCVPRRRRQHPPDPAVRRARRRAGQARLPGEPRDPGRVHSPGRQRDRRARHRRRKDGIHAQALFTGRSGRHGGPAPDVQSRRALQSVKDAAGRRGVHRAIKARAGDAGLICQWSVVVSVIRTPRSNHAAGRTFGAPRLAHRHPAAASDRSDRSDPTDPSDSVRRPAPDHHEARSKPRARAPGRQSHPPGLACSA